MKLGTILTAACLLIASALSAQDNSTRFTFRVGAGIPGAGAEYFVQGFNKNNYGLAAIYSDYYSDTKAIPAICAEGYYTLNEWFRVGLDFVYTSYTNQAYDGITGQLKRDRKGQTFIALPTASVNYLEKNAMKLYISLGAGLGYYSGFDNLSGNLSFEVQFIPIGIELGRKVFGFAEAGIGTAVSWVRGGVGVRF